MIRNRDIIHSLPLVASALGDCYGVTVSIGGSRAYTDGKQIHVPTLPLDCEEDVLALARGFVDHEAAHIRETDFAAVRKARLTPLETWLWNALEDWRVERVLSARFPGCRQNLHWLALHMLSGDTTGTPPDPALALLSWILLRVRAWELPQLRAARDRHGAVVRSAFPRLPGRLNAVLANVRTDCRTTNDTLNAARQLATIIRAAAETATPPSLKSRTKSEPDTTDPHPDRAGLHAAERAETESRRGSNARSASDGSLSPLCEDNVEATTETERVGREALQRLLAATSSTPASDASAAASADSDTVSGTTTASGFPKSLGDRVAEALNAHSVCHASDGLSVACEASRTFLPLPASALAQNRQTITALRTRLYDFLQVRTRQPIWRGRRGKVDSQRLHTLATGSPRVFVQTGERQHLSTAVHLLLDASGSMQGPRMELAARACHALATALDPRTGINLGVTVFPASPTADGTPHTVVPLIRHGTRAHDCFSVHGGGGTPLAQALWWVMQQMYPLNEQRKIICILTDGQPDSLHAAQYALAQAQKTGFEILGLGIQDSTLDALLLPLGMVSRTITDLADLAPAMFAMLHQALSGADARQKIVDTAFSDAERTLNTHQEWKKNCAHPPRTQQPCIAPS